MLDEIPRLCILLNIKLLLLPAHEVNRANLNNVLAAAMMVFSCYITVLVGNVVYVGVQPGVREVVVLRLNNATDGRRVIK